MKYIPFFLVGILFGITMTKSEAISWFRILEMFRFESIHMFGILGVGAGLSALFFFLVKKFQWKALDGSILTYTPMRLRPRRHLLAGSIFGLGWALIGACPGPIYVLLGQGYWIFIFVLLGALLGTYTYGRFQNNLPH